MPTSVLQRLRTDGNDDFGNTVSVSTDRGGAPLRCCFHEAVPGERVALVAYQPALIGRAYAEVGPVFIHADACGGYQDANAYREAFRHRSQVLRADDGKGRQVYSMNRITEGWEAEAVTTAVFASPEVDYLHSRNVLAGCFMLTIARSCSAR